VRRQCRTRFTHGAFDRTELSYSTVDEWFCPTAVSNTSPASSTNAASHHTRGQCNTGPYIPPMLSVSYGSSFSPPPTLWSYPPSHIPTNSESHPNCPAPHVVPTTVSHDQRSQSYSMRDHLWSLPCNNKEESILAAEDRADDAHITCSS